jgi:hypothetical protein
MPSDKEILEQRLSLFTHDAWGLFVEELTAMAHSMDTIQTVDDEKALFQRKGEVSILNMMINLQETTKLALDQLELDV